MAQQSAAIWDELDGPRTLRPEELEGAHQLAVRCFGHSTLQDLPAGAYRATARQTVEVVCHRGVPVSQIGITYSQLSIYGSLVQTASLGGVGTHADYRGQGLATRLLRHCMDTLTARGSRLLLISGTRGLYQRAGCTRAQSFERVSLRSGQVKLCPTEVTIRPATSEDAHICARLYQAEAVRFVRSLGEYRDHLERGERDPGDDNWIVEAEGRPVAYVFLGVPWGVKQEQRVREVFVQGEYGGSRVAVVAALPELMTRSDLTELWIAVPWQDADLRQLLHERGIRGELGTMSGYTIRIVDFPGLMDDLHGYSSARLGRDERRGLRFEQDGDRYVIARERERIELDGAAMTRLVLGKPDDTSPGIPTLPPVLGSITTQLFPLPSFLRGLDFR